MFHKILLCTDGSEYSLVALQTAVELARQWKSSLRALFVIETRDLEGSWFADLSGALGIQPYQSFYSQLEELHHQRGKLVLEECRKSAEAAGVTFEGIQLVGNLATIATEQEQDCDLVVLGQRGENARYHGDFIGHSVERIVRNSVSPCLVTTDQYRAPTSAVVAVDGNPPSRHALETAILMASTLGTKLHLVSVDENDAEKAGDALMEAMREVKARGLNATEQILNGTPATEITHYADEIDAGIIITGAYGHGLLRELILGSTTQQILSSARRPLLMAR